MVFLNFKAMNEKLKNTIGSNTFVSVGLISTIVIVAVSWGAMWQTVKSLEEQNLNSRVTVLETTIPQIFSLINEIKELIKNQ